MHGALFDLDGVIADTATYHFSAWKMICKKYFNKELPDEIEILTKGVSREDSLKVILNYLEENISDEIFELLLKEKNDLYVSMLDNITSKEILPGILPLIKELKRRGFKLALASASRNAPFILEKLGIIELFDAIVDPATVAKGKPAPDIFLAAASAIQVPIDMCIGFEDSIAGVQAINSAGAISVGIGNKSELSQADIIFTETSTIDINKTLG